MTVEKTREVIYFSFDSKLVEMIVAHRRMLENAGQW